MNQNDSDLQYLANEIGATSEELNDLTDQLEDDQTLIAEAVALKHCVESLIVECYKLQ
jgi:hypothetical protein